MSFLFAPENSLDTIEDYIAETRKLVDSIPDEELFEVADSISLWSIHSQLAHVWWANDFCLKNARKLVTGEYDDEGGKVKMLGWVVLFSAFIPRGKGRRNVPLPDVATREDLLKTIAEAEQQVQVLRGLSQELKSSRRRSKHPVLGHFTALEWLRFVWIHTKHHLKICYEIRALQSSRKAAS